MIKINQTITICNVENNLPEPQLDLKSCNDRTKIVLEPVAGKLVLDTEELEKAIALIKKFSADNPVTEGEQVLAESGNMQVEFVDKDLE